jgi:hypothetical protein
MNILRSYIAPFVAILVFLFALVAVSARIFLPSDMSAPAPIGDMGRREDGKAIALSPTYPNTSGLTAPPLNLL